MWDTLTLLSESNVLHAASKECIFSKSLLQQNHQISSRVFRLTQADLFDSLLIQISFEYNQKVIFTFDVLTSIRGLHQKKLVLGLLLPVLGATS